MVNINNQYEYKMAEMLSTTAVCFLLFSFSLSVLNIFAVLSVLIAFTAGILFISEPIRCIIKMKDVKTSNPLGFNGIMLLRALGWTILVSLVFVPGSVPFLGLLGAALVVYTVGEEQKISYENKWG